MTAGAWLALRRTGERVLPGILFLLLVVAVYADPLFFRRNFGGRDLIVYNLPMEKAIHDAYARGRLPLWVPEISGGRPLLPNPNAGALYPLRPALSLVSFPVAMRIYPVLHWALAGVGMMVLFSSLGASRAGGWVAAVTYGFCGVAVSEVFFPHIQPGMALLPWIVWAVDRRVGSPGRKVLLLSFFFGLDFLAGDVFTIGLALLCALLWIAAEMEPRARGRALSSLGLSLALAALLAAPQIVATALWIPETSRSVLGMKLGDSLFFSISPLRLLELVLPFPFGPTWAIEPARIWGWPVFHGKAMGLFASLYAGAFGVIALADTRNDRSPGARFARILFLVVLGLSVPSSILPASWRSLPSPLPLRNPEKLAVALAFALAILSGLCAGRLGSATVRRRWPLAVGALFALFAGLSRVFPEEAGLIAATGIGAAAVHAQIAAQWLPTALAEGGLLWMVTVVALDLARLGSARGRAAALLLLTAVPIASNRRIARTFQEHELFAPPTFVEVLRRADPAGHYRVLGESVYAAPSRILAFSLGSDAPYADIARRLFNDHSGVLWNRGTVLNADFDVGDLSRVESLRRVASTAARYTDSSAFFGSLSLRFGIRFRDQEPLAGFRRFGGNALLAYDVHANAYPDIRLLERWSERANPVEAFQALPRLAAGEVVLESGSNRSGRAGPGEVRVLRQSPESLSVETRVGEPTWLFVLRDFWGHRRVLVDGREVAVVPAQLAFSAVPVPAGVHRVDWSERLAGGEVSRFGPVLYFVIVGSLLLAHRVRSHR